MPSAEKLAQILDISPEILPYFAELLADVWNLGSWPQEIIELIRSVRLPALSTTVLDLGCGKGAVSIPLAKELQYRIRGIDLFPAFINEAIERAKQLDVHQLCHYELADMQDVLRESQTYDVVIFAAIGGALGDFEECIGILRAVCRSGGYIVIDDGYLAKDSLLYDEGYEHYRSYDETVRQLSSGGDCLIGEKILSVSKLQEYNRNTTELIRGRANKLAQKFPDKTHLFEQYVQFEETESNILESETIPAIWMFQRK